jgi:glycosyltransferase involved in cell wall biosynthesis
MGRRFALLSHLLPPSATGQPVMIGRLLSGVAPEEYCLIGLAGASPPEARVVAGGTLPATCHRLPVEQRLRGAGRVGLPVLDWQWRLRQRVRNLRSLLRSATVQVLVACSGDLLNIPAAALAAGRTGARVIAYYFDDYPHQWISSSEACFAAACERRLIARGSAFIVPNEFLRDELLRRGARRVAVVRNPLPDEPRPDAAAAPWPTNPETLDIVFAGAIYHAHADAFRNLLAAMEVASDLRPKLRLLTAQPQSDLEKLGITGPRIERSGHLDDEQIQQALRSADVLFLPLAFDSPIAEVIRTSSPGKLADYLITGRPVLVHAPSDSFPVWYARKNACAWVVDQRAPQTLAGSLREIASEAGARRMVTGQAVACAQRDFSVESARRALFQLLERA